MLRKCLEKLSDVWRKSKGSPNSIQPFIFVYYLFLSCFRADIFRQKWGADMWAAFDRKYEQWTWLLSNENVMLMVCHFYEISIEYHEGKSIWNENNLMFYNNYASASSFIVLAHSKKSCSSIANLLVRWTRLFHYCLNCRCRCINIDAFNPGKVKVWRKCWPDLCSAFV